MADMGNANTGYRPGRVWSVSAAGEAKTKRWPDDPSCQPCPDCGGLECLCRPRFFAGQLLTEQDLNRLDHYITEKHKLHNRHLWGWGVVCGLQVRCNPCDEMVTVTSGYALSPCGEDIVVCKDDTVDICALISRCREREEPDCRPYARPKDSCEDITEQWVLAIRYAETPSRGTTPLTGPSSCGCKSGGKSGSCGGTRCGGTKGCGCGSGPSTGCCGDPKAPAAKTESPRIRRGAPPSCEPTLTCETYRYEVFRAPDPKPDDPKGGQDSTNGFSGVFASLEGDMFANIRCCWQKLEKAIPPLPGDITVAIPVADQPKWRQWCYRTRQSLGEFFAKNGGFDCERIEQLAAIVCPAATQDAAAFTAAMQQVALAYAILVFEALIDCVCNWALPPCPCPDDPRVPLAVVTVNRKGCHIVSVCNWTLLRKHVLTFPTLRYWFGWIPIARLIREAMHSLCCKALDLPEQVRPPGASVPPVAAFAMAAHAPPETDTSQPLNRPLSFKTVDLEGIDTMVAQAIAQRMSGQQTMVAGDLVRAALSRASFTATGPLEGDARKSEIDRLTGTGQVRVLAELLRPLTGVIGAGGDLTGKAGATDQAAEIASLREEVSALKEAVASLRKRRR